MNALVTGGARGIGLELVRGLVARGHRCCVVDRDAELLQRVAGELGDAVVVYRADVRSTREVEAAFEGFEELAGPLGLAVANAGYATSRHVLDVDERAWREMLDVNLGGAVRTCRAAARRMAAQGGGTILLASSTAAVASEPGLTGYAAAKAGVLALSRAMAHDLAETGVRVHAVLPGNCLGPLDRWPSVELGRLYDARIAIGRSASPPEIAAAYLHLVDSAHAASTGTALIVDGGMLAWE